MRSGFCLRKRISRSRSHTLSEPLPPYGPLAPAVPLPPLSEPLPESPEPLLLSETVFGPLTSVASVNGIGPGSSGFWNRIVWVAGVPDVVDALFFESDPQASSSIAEANTTSGPTSHRTERGSCMRVPPGARVSHRPAAQSTWRAGALPHLVPHTGRLPRRSPARVAGIPAAALHPLGVPGDRAGQAAAVQPVTRRDRLEGVHTADLHVGHSHPRALLAPAHGQQVAARVRDQRPA